MSRSISTVEVTFFSEVAVKLPVAILVVIATAGALASGVREVTVGLSSGLDSDLI